MGARLSVALGLGSLAGLYVLRQHRDSSDSKQQKERAERRHGAFIDYWGPPPEQPAAAAARHQSRPPPPAPPGTPAGATAAAGGGDGDDERDTSPNSFSNWNAPADLAGLMFAVKDIFDIAGRVTGFGSPAWRASHAPATRTAHAVAAASAAGAACVGVTHMDEMAYSINGENAHYGTPDNPAPGCAGRVPGGSSSGSAVAVAAGYADFALGTDTGGSVRVPAAWCGVVGVRPSHGAVSVAGVVPMAQSLDVVGWLARDATVARAVGRALLGPGGPRPRRPGRVLVAEDLVAASCCGRGKRREEERRRQERVVAAAVAAVRRAVGPVPVARTRVGEHLAAEVPELLAAAGEEEGQVRGVAALEGVRDAVRLVQALEFRGNHEAWVAAERPVLGPGIGDRVRAAMATPDDERVRRARAVRRGVAAAMARLLQGDAVLVMPTVPAGPPPRRGRPAAELEEVRSRAFVLLSLAGASGCCQVSVPVGNVDGMGGAPGSVSFLARPGADHLLLDTLMAMQETSGTPDRWKLDLES